MRDSCNAVSTAFLSVMFRLTLSRASRIWAMTSLSAWLAPGGGDLAHMSSSSRGGRFGSGMPLPLLSQDRAIGAVRLGYSRDSTTRPALPLRTVRYSSASGFSPSR